MGDGIERREGGGLHGRLSQFQPWETAGLPLTSWLVGVSSHKDQILGLEHDQRLWDLARREAFNQSPINVDQKTAWDHSPLGHQFIYTDIVYCNGNN